MIYLYAWLLVGFGVWLGAVSQKFGAYKKHGFISCFVGFVLTILIWPIAIIASLNRDSLMSSDAS